MNRIFNRLGLTAVAIVAGGTGLIAQQSTSTIKGMVTDAASGAPKGGVTVTVVNPATQLTLTHVTDASGRFTFFALPVGRYQISYTSNGRTYKAERVGLLGQDTDASFKFPVDASAVVEVVATRESGIATVNTASAEVGVNVESATISALPIFDRNINSAAVLAPGVSIIQGSQVDPTKKTSTYIVSGDGQGRGTNFNVDGADNNSSDVGGYVLPIPMDAIDQFQVVTNQYKAEFGRSNAGFLNVVTKSGGNEFAGALNAQFTNQNLRARRTDETPKLDNDQETYSAMVSGPILKDQLFYMVAAEKTHGSTGQTFAPAAVAAFPSLASTPTVLDKYNLYTKLNWIINQNWTTEFKYARYYDTSANQTFPHTDTVAGYVSPTMLGTNRDDTSMYGAKLTGVFGSAVWESTLNHFDYTNNIRSSQKGPNGDTSIEVRFEPSLAASSTDLWRNGVDPNAYQNTGVKRNQWKNEVSLALDHHTLKAGVDLQKTDYPFEKYFWANPTVYIMDVNSTIQNAWSNSLTQLNVDRVTLTAPIENPATSFKSYGMYLQDDWFINNNLSINGGLRLDWDTQLDYYSQYDSMYSQIHAANPGLVGIGAQAPRTHHYGSPRLQALYKPEGDDTLTFKLGYGRFVASTIDNVVGFSRALGAPVNGIPGGYIYNNAARTAMGLSTKSAASGGIANFAAGTILAQVNGHNLVLPADLTPYNYANNVGGLQDYFNTTVAGWLTPASFSTGGRELLASDFSYPTTETLNFGFAYKLSDHSNLDVMFLYSKTKHLTVQYTTDGSQPFTDYGPGGAAAGDMGDSIFLSNQTSSQKQMQVKYSYTTSKMTFIATFVAKEMKSTNGGDGGSFSNTGAADFYGTGATYPWLTGPERISNGTESFSGSFAWSYRADFGTEFSLLGQWHSGKYYDIYLGNSPNPGFGPGGGSDLGDPNPVVGTGVGQWNMDVGLKISQTFKFGKKTQLIPYIMIQNLLNNYDYGNNYQNQVYNGDGSYNTQLNSRGPNWQANSPRTAAVGVRMIW
jgi:Carboxypeptidase regulatory-like domain/TonB dependent receptor